MRIRFVPVLRASRYRYAGPGPYLQLRKPSTVTLALRLSTGATGEAVGVSDGVTVGVTCSVGVSDGYTVAVDVPVGVMVAVAVAVEEVGAAVNVWLGAAGTPSTTADPQALRNPARMAASATVVCIPPSDFVAKKAPPW
jgi:hypothetical protein